jgi:hypothetical protein
MYCTISYTVLTTQSSLQSLDNGSVSAQQFSVLLPSWLSLVVSLVEISALMAPAVQSDVRTKQAICAASDAARCRARCVLVCRCTQ